MRIIEVDCCKECPFSEYGLNKVSYYCKKYSLSIPGDDASMISDLCRLKTDGRSYGLHQLEQLRTVTHDGDLICKAERDLLLKHELITKVNGGWNVITPHGVEIMIALGVLKS